MRLSSIQKRFYKYIPRLLIVIGILLLSLSFGPLIKDEIWFFIKETKEQEFSLEVAEEESVRDSVFARFLSTKPIKVDPASKDFGLVIERIGVNVPIVRDVPVWDEDAYMEALKGGVAHASSSAYPSTNPGNVYLFAHASLNFWKLGQYSTVFNLLRKLEKGDKIHVFYEGEDYIYRVLSVEKVKGWDTYPLTRAVIEPVLTLQTCDPPGTTINRLVVTAELLEVKESD